MLALETPSELAALLVVIDIPKDVQKRGVDLLRKVAGLKAAAVFGKGQTGAFLYHQCQSALSLHDSGPPAPPRERLTLVTALPPKTANLTVSSSFNLSPCSSHNPP